MEELKEIIEEDMTKDDELLQIVLNTREQGEMIERLIESQIKVKDELINKLHKELEYYKQDVADRFIDQVMKAIIKVKKDMGKQLESENFVNGCVEDVQREYRYIFEDLTDLLEQQNIDSYTTPIGDLFDPAIHVLKLEITDNPTLDKTIKESLSEGYKKGDKVLLPERVIVYQYKAQEKGE